MITAARFVGVLEPGTSEWVEHRRARIGGSEIAAILGLSPWDSLFSLWHRKQGLIGEEADNRSMDWGRRLESVILDRYLEDRPEAVVRRPGGTWVNVGRDYQSAAPDALVCMPYAEPVVVEVKTAHDGYEWGEPGTDDIPPYYRAQVLWYLDCLGLSEAHVVVLIGGSDYREFVTGYDAADAVLLREAAERFIKSLADGERPDVDAHSVTYQALRELHPEISDVDVEVDADLAAEYRAACDACRSADAAKGLVVAKLADAMGGARRAVAGGELVALRKAVGVGRPFITPARQRKEAKV